MKAIEVIKSRLTEEKVKELLSMLGAKHITKNGETIRCTCPIHLGDNASAFSWNMNNGLWFCFTGDCGGGDVFDLVAKKYDIDIDEKFKYLIRVTAEMLCIDLTGIEIDDRAERNIKDTRNFVRNMLSKMNKKENEPYNLKTLGSLYTLNNWGNFEGDFLQEHNVFYVKEYNRVGFGIEDEDGNIVGAVLRRCNEQDNPKWLNRPKSVYTGSLLYNLHNIKGKYSSVHIVEGIRDCLQLKKIGVENVVCTFGSHITDEQLKLLMKYFTEIIIMFDNDVAGIKATRKVIQKYKFIFDIKIPDYTGLSIKDPGQIETLEQFKELQYLKWFEWEEINKLTQ